MNTFFISNYSKRIITLTVLFVFSLHLTFAQQLVGKWKCAEETLKEMEFNFTKVKSKCTFKKNGTFTLVLKGYSMKGVYTPYRYMSAEVKGKYILNGNTITSTIDAKDIEVGVGTDMEDPARDESIMDNRDVTGNRAEWSYANRRYETELFNGKVQEQTIREKILEMWTWDGLPVSPNGKDGINIGNMIKLRK